MLKVCSVVLEVVKGVRPVIEEIEKRDGDLGRQLRRAVTSVALNISEGMGSRGRNRGVRYNTALGSMRETLACIEVGVALGYVASVEEGLLDRIDHVLATLFKLC